MSNNAYGDWEDIPASDMGWEAVPSSQNVEIDPETGRPFDPSLPTRMALERERKRGATAKAQQSTASKVADVIGKVYDESKLAGLAPEISPLMGLFETTGAAMTGAKLSPMISAPFKATGQVLGELASDTTKTAYKIGREGTEAMRTAFKSGKAEGLDEADRGISGIAKYFKRFYPDQNMADVNKAVDMSKREGGVWDVAQKAREAEAKIAQINPRSNWSFPENAALVLPKEQQVKAGQLTEDLARRTGKEATWLPNAVTLAKVLGKPTSAGSLASPRLQANLAYGAGRASNLMGKGGDLIGTFPRLSDSELYALGLLSPRIRNSYEEQKMAKTKISEFSSVPANNTDIDGIFIGEGMLPSNVNNSFRELMSQLKNQQDGSDGSDFTVGGNLTVNGSTTVAGATIYNGTQTFNGAADFNSTANFDGIVTMNGTVNLGAAINGDGGTIDGTAIGSVTPAAITGTSVTSTTGFVGNLTGNVTGNVTGNLTGNASTATTATTATSATTATTATTATNIAGGGANQIAYNTGVGATNFLPAGTSGLVLTSNGSGSAPTWQVGVPSGTASNLAGGAVGQVPYQTGAGATTFLPVGATGQVLTVTAGLPAWQTLTLPVSFTNGKAYFFAGF